MKRRVCRFVVLGAIFMVGAALFAQERNQIKVKGSQVVTGVVIVDIVRGGKSLELQCNEGMALCAPLKSGTYWMVELPEHFGMYDCRNVEIYRMNNGDPSTAERLGQYCLIEK